MNEALLEAHDILKAARVQACNGAICIWMLLDHATAYLNKQIEDELRG